MKIDTKEAIGKICFAAFFLSLLVFCTVGSLWYNGIIGRTPKVGDYYIEDYQHDNPFIAHETNVVLSVKNGYISFRNSKGEWNNTVSNFRCIHKHVGHVPPPKPIVEDP